MKKIATIICGLACLCAAQAQNSYSFSKENGSYTELSGAKRVSFALLDTLSGFYRLDELKGEVFTWYNTNFKIDTIKTFHIQPYANLRFDNDSMLIIVDGAFTYLDSIDNNSSVSYTITGNSGEKIIKTQWKNLKIRVGQAVNFVNLQIWVYQSTGVFEIHYGPSSSNNQSGFLKTTGPQVGIFFSRDNFSKCHGKLWVNGSPDALKLDSATNYVFNAMSGVPVNGTVFRFTPRFAIAATANIKTASGIRLFPNPVSGDFLRVDVPDSYTVLDARGQALLVSTGSDNINISKLKPGVYFLRNSAGFSARFLRM